MSRWVPLLITWPVTISLAHILSPQDYGYLALVTVFTRFGRIVAEAGVSNTIVLGPQLTDEEYRSLHGFSFLTFIGVAATLSLLAFPIEIFYGRQGMREVIWALSVGFAFDGLSLVPTALLRRRLQFRSTATAEIVRVLVESSLTLSLALAGWKYWALVGGYLTGAFAGTCSILIAARVRLGRPRMATIRKVRSSANRLLTASMSNFLAQSSDASIGGLVVSAASLGGYSYMAGLARSPIEKLSGIVTYASASLFGNVRESRERVVSVLNRICVFSALAMFPVLGGIAVVAPDLVQGILGAKWQPYISVLQLMCFQAALLPLTAALDNALIATGQEHIYATNGLLTLGILPPSFYLLGKTFGAPGLALAWLVPAPILLVRRLAALKRSAGLEINTWVRMLVRPIIVTSLMITIVIAVRSLPILADLPPLYRLALCSFIGAVVCVILTILLCADQVSWFAGIDGAGRLGKAARIALAGRQRLLKVQR